MRLDRRHPLPIRNCPPFLAPWWGLVFMAIAAFVSGATPALAQGAIYGMVRSAATGAPVSGATIALRTDTAMAHSTLTDRNGFYQIGGVSAGTYTFVVQHVGFREAQRPLEIGPGGRFNLDVTLEAGAVELEGVTVQAAAGAAIRPLGRQRIRPADLRLTPVPAGTGDLASYLQTLPGVTTTGDRGGQLFVRGGTAAENLVLVDGIPIYQPFHIFGFFSVFPEPLIADVDFYAGGFGARYSGRTASVLDVALRDGDTGGPRGSASLSPFLAELTAEGPIGGGASWLVSARRSLIDETSSALLGSQQPIAFESQLAKVTATDGEDLRCSALAIRTHDSGRLDPDEHQSQVSWSNVVAGARCVTTLDRIFRLLEANFSYSSLENSAVSRGTSRFRSRIWRLQQDVHATSMIGSVPIYAGAQLQAELTDYDLRELYGVDVGDSDLFGVGSYLEVSIPLGRVEVRPGVVAALEPRVAIEPRLRAAWQPFGRGSEVLQAGVGIHRQDVVGTSDLRDVGSVFNAWMPTPEDAPIEVVQGILGWQQAIGSGLTWSLEGYFRRLRNLPIPVWRAVAEFNTQLGVADGESRGADLRIEYTAPQVQLLLGYGFARTDYHAAQDEFATWFNEPVQSYQPPHDRRHQVNAAARGTVRGFELSARWQYGSGMPFTRPLGFDDAFNFGELPHDVTAVPGTTRLILDRPFNARLPAMHRLDLSAGRAFRLPIGMIDLQAGAINSYDQRNIFYYDLFSGRRVDQLPLVPYAAITFRTER